jgi:hypothetical protein
MGRRDRDAGGHDAARMTAAVRADEPYVSTAEKLSVWLTGTEDPDAACYATQHEEYIANVFDGRVDVVDRAGLKRCVRPAATHDAIYAF